MIKPSYWVCGAGGSHNCEYWDDVNGCWKDQKSVEGCLLFSSMEEERDDLLEVGDD